MTGVNAGRRTSTLQKLRGMQNSPILWFSRIVVMGSKVVFFLCFFLFDLCYSYPNNKSSCAGICIVEMTSIHLFCGQVDVIGFNC